MSTQKIALVTGASSGIGRATAERLLRDGYVVYGAARRVEKMAELDTHERGHAVHLDVTDESSCEAAVQTILDAHGHVDVLINNAGYGSYGAVEDVSLDEARRQFDVNLFGLARVTQLVLPAMRAQRSGTIVNISSIGGKIYTPLGAWYHATKHALEGWSDALRLELADFGIRVVIVEPGAIGTEWDGIAVENMMEVSGDGPYAAFAEATKRFMEDGYEGGGSPPSVIADVVSEAVASAKPKTRYAAGENATLALWGRRLLPDRIFDAMIRARMN